MSNNRYSSMLPIPYLIRLYANRCIQSVKYSVLKTQTLIGICASLLVWTWRSPLKLTTTKWLILLLICSSTYSRVFKASECIDTIVLNFFILLFTLFPVLQRTSRRSANSTRWNHSRLSNQRKSHQPFPLKIWIQLLGSLFII